MAKEEVRRIFVFIYENDDGEFVAQCPRLDLFATGDDEDVVSQSMETLLQEHLAFAKKNGFNFDDIATPLPSGFEEMLGEAATREEPKSRGRANQLAR